MPGWTVCGTAWRASCTARPGPPLLIWLYDEHGSYYGHVPPSEAVPPDDVPAHNYVLDPPRSLRTLLSPVSGGGFTRVPEPALRWGSRGSPRRRRAMATGW
jgi:hypothetical protein